jgi:hypothetical protein
MSVLRPGDVAGLQFVRASLSFPDPYRLLQTGPTAKGLKAASRDAQGNRLIPDVVIEDGFCRLLNRALQPEERLIADSLGWTLAYAITMPVGSGVSADHRVQIGRRVFHCGPPQQAGEWATSITVVAEERSR